MVIFAQTDVQKGTTMSGNSNSDGVFVATNTTTGHVVLSVEKAGYYHGFVYIAFDEPGPWSTNAVVTLTEVPSAGVTVQVTGLGSQPIAGAEASVGFETSFDTTVPRDIRKGLTDIEGRFAATGKTVASVGIGVTKEGYYASHLYADMGTNTFLLVPIVLKERKNPVAMYAKQADLAKPNAQTNTLYGYDLRVGDWVTPHGKGLVNDFLFKTDGYYNNPGDYDSVLSLSFSNPNDGVVLVSPSERAGSDLRSLQEAPTNGYTNSRVWHMKRAGGQFVEDRLSGVDYYFRVRSMTNLQGQVTNALYGKIYGDIGFMCFTYYLNPDATRNVEFDPKKNLFPTPGGRGVVTFP